MFENKLTNENYFSIIFIFSNFLVLPLARIADALAGVVADGKGRAIRGEVGQPAANSFFETNAII